MNWISTTPDTNNKTLADCCEEEQTNFYSLSLYLSPECSSSWVCLPLHCRHTVNCWNHLIGSEWPIGIRGDWLLECYAYQAQWIVFFYLAMKINTCGSFKRRSKYWEYWEYILQSLAILSKCGPCVLCSWHLKYWVNTLFRFCEILCTL